MRHGDYGSSVTEYKLGHNAQLQSPELGSWRRELPRGDVVGFTGLSSVICCQSVTVICHHCQAVAIYVGGGCRRQRTVRSCHRRRQNPLLLHLQMVTARRWKEKGENEGKKRIKKKEEKKERKEKKKKIKEKKRKKKICRS